ncbi:hypothetical protein CGGC5_v002219 [Colletotrichum fructicola Nara gc5]|uniref:Uncharacterized protein n=1 Tax=Colletotrichum fructicola (strain Nara gc5) TaxID=1213859 RepID=A0A7J6JNR8_COLFN|nr:hypothetical protein CGGC5_v002219 [Colletotrichum fructicola Nara gc5]
MLHDGLTLQSQGKAPRRMKYVTQRRVLDSILRSCLSVSSTVETQKKKKNGVPPSESMIRSKRPHLVF